MCHYLLPSARASRRAADGRYGDEAIEAMVEPAARRHRAVRLPGPPVRRRRHHARGHGLKFNVGERNIEQGFR
jgi:hypothetical protein